MWQQNIVGVATVAMLQQWEWPYMAAEHGGSGHMWPQGEWPHVGGNLPLNQALIGFSLNAEKGEKS